MRACVPDGQSKSDRQRSPKAVGGARVVRHKGRLYHALFAKEYRANNGGMTVEVQLLRPVTVSEMRQRLHFRVFSTHDLERKRDVVVRILPPKEKPKHIRKKPDIKVPKEVEIPTRERKTSGPERFMPFEPRNDSESV